MISFLFAHVLCRVQGANCRFCIKIGQTCLKAWDYQVRAEDRACVISRLDLSTSTLISTGSVQVALLETISGFWSILIDSDQLLCSWFPRS